MRSTCGKSVKILPQELSQSSPVLPEAPFSRAKASLAKKDRWLRERECMNKKLVPRVSPVKGLGKKVKTSMFSMTSYPPITSLDKRNIFIERTFCSKSAKLLNFKLP